MGSGMNKTLYEEMEDKILALAWLAGFAASAEGSNGEYPHELPDNPLEGEVEKSLWAEALAYAENPTTP